MAKLTGGRKGCRLLWELGSSIRGFGHGPGASGAFRLLMAVAPEVQGSVKGGPAVPGRVVEGLPPTTT